MLVLDATIGGAASNSYATVAQADAYHDAHVYGSAWQALTVPEKERALVHATRLLDDYVTWYGTKATRGQALRWPRYAVAERDGSWSATDGSYWYDALYGTFTLDASTVPGWLANATAELARELVKSDRTAESDILEFSSLTVGSLSITKDQTTKKRVLPESVRAMVSPYGTIRGGGSGVIHLVRA